MSHSRVFLCRFKDLAGGPAAVSRLWERHQGSGKKVEEYAFKCVESLGGGKNLSDSSNGSVRRTDSGNGSLAPPRFFVWVVCFCVELDV